MTVVSLGDFVEIRTGKLDANAAVDGGEYPFFTCAREASWIDKAAFDTDAVLVAGNGDLNVKHFAGKFNAYQRTYVIESRDQNRLNTRFLFYFLDRYVETLRRQSIGGVIKYIKLSNLTDAPIPLFSINEQCRIAAILDKADEIRSKREQALALADDFLSATFLDMFGGQDWVCQPLSEVVSAGTSVTYGIVQAGPEVPGGVPYIRTGDIQNGNIVTSDLRHTSKEIESRFDRSKVTAGDIVMSIRATVGTTAIVPNNLDGANLTQGTARISPGPKVTKEYLLSYLRSHKCQSWIQRQVKGATFREITLTRLREMEIPLPPISLQAKFSEIFQNHDRFCDQKIKIFDGASTLFQSLSQRAFRGEL